MRLGGRTRRMSAPPPPSVTTCGSHRFRLRSSRRASGVSPRTQGPGQESRKSGRCVNYYAKSPCYSAWRGPPLRRFSQVTVDVARPCGQLDATKRPSLQSHKDPRQGTHTTAEQRLHAPTAGATQPAAYHDFLSWSAVCCGCCRPGVLERGTGEALTAATVPVATPEPNTPSRSAPGDRPGAATSSGPPSPDTVHAVSAGWSLSV